MFVGSSFAGLWGVLRKCANLDCSRPFLYLRAGRLFHFPRDREERSQNARAMEAFWLCGQCSETMTLQWRIGEGVIAVPLEHRRSVMSKPLKPDWDLLTIEKA